MVTRHKEKNSRPEKERHEFPDDHGYRKWFKTRCELAGMKSIYIEILMGLSMAISDSYYRTAENELLDELTNRFAIFRRSQSVYRLNKHLRS